MKKITLIVLSAVILFAAPSCKKQQCKVIKHVVSEEFVYAEPCDNDVDVTVNVENNIDMSAIIALLQQSISNIFIPLILNLCFKDRDRIPFSA